MMVKLPWSTGSRFSNAMLVSRIKKRNSKSSLVGITKWIEPTDPASNGSLKSMRKGRAHQDKGTDIKIWHCIYRKVVIGLVVVRDDEHAACPCMCTEKHLRESQQSDAMQQPRPWSIMKSKPLQECATATAPLDRIQLERRNQNISRTYTSLETWSYHFSWALRSTVLTRSMTRTRSPVSATHSGIPARASVSAAPLITLAWSAALLADSLV